LYGTFFAQTAEPLVVFLRSFKLVLSSVRYFISLSSCLSLVVAAVRQQYLLKKPDAKLLKKKKNPQEARLKEDSNLVANANFDIFHQPAYVEQLCAQWDTSLICIASHSKKKPHSLTLARLFNYHLLDAIQFTVLAHRPISAFRGTKCQLGAKPCLIFSGEAWQSQETHRHLANLLVDFFRGRVVSQLSLAGLDHVLLFAANDEQHIYLRHYTIHLKRSGTKIPRVELDEMGPALDLRIVQCRWASDDLRREALKLPKELKPKKSKNVTTNVMKEKVGRVFVPKQDISKLVPANIKALRRKRKRQNWEEGQEPEIKETNISPNAMSAHTTTQETTNRENGDNSLTAAITMPSAKKIKTTANKS
jgi:ribosome production factor 2